VLWIAFISVAFCLPELNPTNSQTLNYAPVAIEIVLGFWAISARRWFAERIKQIAGVPALYSFVDESMLMTSDRLAQRKRCASVLRRQW
jgi:hypothetical protein